MHNNGWMFKGKLSLKVERMTRQICRLVFESIFEKLSPFCWGALVTPYWTSGNVGLYDRLNDLWPM